MLATRLLVAFFGATITLAVLTSSGALELMTPDLEAFANYEDMQRYITSRSQRSMRLLDNPTHDSYINAYNDHHESATTRARERRSAKDLKTRKLPSEPQLVKFEIEDAVEPSAEVKELIRQHRSREEKLTTENSSAVSKTSKAATTTTAAPKRSTRATRTKKTRSKRPKRATSNVAQNKQQFNFQVQLIPFDVSEAREPDEQTKALIRRMRNLELEKLRKDAATSTAAPTVVRVHRNAPAPTSNRPQTVPVAVAPTFNPAKYYRPKTGKFFMKRKGKRVKRSAPQMISFGVEDARQPDAATLEHLRLARQSYEARNAQQGIVAAGKTSAINKREARMDSAKEGQNGEQQAQPMNEAEADEEGSDLSGGESKRTFVYKAAPIVKTKKSLSTLPAEVQKIITQLMKEQGAGGSGGAGGGKAYVKYIPAQKVDYRHLKSAYGAKLALPTTYTVGSHGKLSPASYMKYIPPQQKSEQLQVQIHPVPVVEKVHYIYTPVQAVAVGHGGGGYMVGGGEEQPAVQAAAAHALQAAYAGPNVHAVAEAQAAQAAHAVQAAQAQHYPEMAQVSKGYGGQNGGADEAKGGGTQEGSRPVEAAMTHHPIIVQEGGASSYQVAPAPTHVHHTYAADVSHAFEEDVPVAVAIKAVNFRPSKPDPLLNENKISEAGEQEGYAGNEGYSASYEGKGYGGSDSQQAAAEYAKQAGDEEEKYKYEIESAEQAEKKAEPPLVKIEYHGPADALKQNFKELPEFKQLSTLVGKSTEDQIHGLTYLLAKEMQNKLKMQRLKAKGASEQESHTNTSPIVFPLEEQQEGAQKQQQEAEADGGNADGGGIHGRLIGMAKSKEYIPIVEQAPSAEQKANAEGGAEKPAVQEISIPGAKQYKYVKIEPKVQLPNSYMAYGLSPNYQVVKGSEDGEKSGYGGGQKAKLVVKQIISHPSMKYKYYGGDAYAKAVASEAELQGEDASHNQCLEYDDELQYASKYAFGYRIRDFSTGNDFGHKQNRDLDGVTRGQYHILLPDGRIQNVIYHADDTGFHADVSFETGH